MGSERTRRMRMPQRGWVMVMAGLALAACSETAGPELVLDETLNADVAMVAAQATIDDVTDMWLTQELLGPVGIPGLHGGRGLPEGNPNRRGDLSRSHTVTLYDADGVEMGEYDPLLTDRIVAVMDASASRDGVRWDATMERHREMELSGLAGEETERTWNGSGTDAVNRTRFDDDAGERSYAMQGSVAIADVVVAVPRQENPWPLSGSITRHVDVTIVNGPNGDESFERTATITFNGTQFATLVVDGEVFEVDLADRRGRRPERQRGG
jgi:hypothetical protein